MAKNYLEDKARNKKSASKALWVFLFFIAVIVSVVAKIFLTGSKPSFFSGMPNSDDAYSVAKKFIEPTIKSSADFQDSKYQFAKSSDSVYVIKSSYASKDASGDKVNTDFKITLKYNGGDAGRQKNWTVLDLSTN